MRLEEALDASTVGAAAIPAVEDIIRCRDGTTWWWLQDRYVQRDRPVKPEILESDGWYPIKPIKPHKPAE